MPDVSLNGIEFEIKGSTDAASSSIDNLIGKLSALNTALSEVANIKKLATGLNSLKKAIDSLNSADLDKVKASLESLGQVSESLSGLAAMSKDLASFMRALSKLAENPENVLDLAQALNVLGSVDLTNLQNAEGALRALADALAALSKSTKAAAPEKHALSWKKLGNTLEAVWKKGIKPVGKFALKALAFPFKQAGKTVADFVKPLKDTLAGFKRILGYRIIRAIIKEIGQAFQVGIQNLYNWSVLVNGRFASSMDMIATSMQYFKNSLGAAVAPIVNALAPAVDFLIDKIVALINVINQLFAKLTGAASWTKAIKKAKDYGEAVGGAGGAAKEALRYLAPFDELNRLPDDNKGGGGGGVAEDYGGMFEEMTEFESGIQDFATRIKDAIAHSDWQGLGTLLGDKLNEIINQINWADFGAKVGGYIRAWFSTQYWTFEAIDFENIGSKIATFLNNMLAEINFEDVGGLIVDKFLAIPEMIIGAINSLDFTTVGDSLGDVLRGFFSTFSAHIDNVDWNETVQNLVQGLINAINGFDLSSVLSSASSFLDSLSGAFSEVDWALAADTLYQGLKDALSELDFGEIVSSIFRFIGSALGAAASVIAQLGKDILTDIWEGIKNAATGWDDNGDGELTGQEIINGIWEGIKSAVANVGTWLKENVWQPFVDGLKSVFGIHSPAETMKEPGSMIGEGILSGISGVFTNVKDWLQENVFDKISAAWDSIKTTFTVVVDAVKEGAEDAWNTLKGGAETIKKTISTVVEKASEWASDAWTAITQPNAVTKTISTAVSKASTWVSEAWTAISQPNAVTKTVSTALSKAKDWASDALDAMKQPDLVTKTVSTALSTAKSWASNAWTALTQPATQTKTVTAAVKNATGKDFNSDTYAMLTGSSKKDIAVTSIVEELNTKKIEGDNGKVNLSTVAKFTSRVNSLSDTEKQFNTVAKFTSRKNELSDKEKQFSTVANFNSRVNGLSDKEKQFSTVANFNSYLNGLGTPSLNSTANLNEAKVDTKLTGAGKPQIDVLARFTGTTGSFANGGAYYGGSWHSIPQYANGGRAHGSIFWAGEAGAELVGHVGGRTEVLNQSQLAATMFAAVSNALNGLHMVISAPSASSSMSDSIMDEETMYRAFSRALADSDLGGDIELDGDVLYRRMVNRNRQNTRLTGVNAMA